VPVHPEIKLNGEPVQGPRTQVITIEIPGQSIFDENFLEDILDWLRPGEKTDDEKTHEFEDNEDMSGSEDTINSENKSDDDLEQEDSDMEIVVPVKP